jgi:hypothetical protein
MFGITVFCQCWVFRLPVAHKSYRLPGYYFHYLFQGNRNQQPF